MAQEIVRSVRVTGSFDGEAELRGAMSRVGSAFDGMAGAAKRAEAVDPTRRYVALQERLDPASRMLKQFGRDLDTVTRQFEKQPAGSGALATYIRDIDRLKSGLQSLGTVVAKGPIVDPNKLLGITSGGGNSAQTFAAAIRRQEEQTRRVREARDLARQSRDEGNVRANNRFFGADQPQAQDPMQRNALASRLAAQAEAFEAAERQREQQAASMAAARSGSLAERQAREQSVVERAMQEKARRDADRAAAEDARQERQFNRPREAKELTRQKRAEQAEALQPFINEAAQRADPLGEAYKRHEATIARINLARQKGLIDETLHAKILASEANTLKNIERDFGAGKGGMRANARTNLGYQGYDVLTGIASGQPLGMIAAQQGPQIAQILGDAPGGIKGGIKDLASTVGGFLTPTRLAFGALGATLLGVAAAWDKFDTSMRAVEQGLRGAGKASTVTAGQIDAASVAASRAGGFGESENRTLFAKLAQTGRLTPEVANGNTGLLTARYARETGQDAAAAGTDMASLLADPARAIEGFQQKIGGITAAQRQFVETLSNGGDKGRAFAEALRLIDANTGSSTEGLTFMQRATRALSKDWDEFTSTLGRGADRLTNSGPLEDRIKRLQGIIATAKSAGLPDESFSTASDQLAKLQAEATKKGSDSAAAASARRGQEMSDAVKQVLPFLDQQLKLEQRIADLTKGGGSGKTVTSGQEAEALDRLATARRTMLDDTQKAQLADQIALRQITDRTVEERSITGEMTKRLELAGQEIKSAENLRRIAEERVREEARARREAQDAIRDARVGLAGSGQNPFDRQMIELQGQRVRDRERMGGPAADQLLGIRQQTALREANRPLKDAALDINGQIELLKVQAATFGQSTAEVSAATKAQEMLNERVRSGAPINAEFLKSVTDISAAYGRLSQAAEDAAYKQGNVIGQLDDLRTGFRGIGSSLFESAGNGFKNFGQTMLKTLQGIGGRSFDRMVGNVGDSIFGRMGKAQDGIFGGGLTELLGGKDVGDPLKGLAGVAGTTTASMSVTAGTVTITGGLGIGAGGIPGLGANDNGAGGASSVLATAAEGASPMVSGAGRLPLRLGAIQALMRKRASESETEPLGVNVRGPQSYDETIPGSAPIVGASIEAAGEKTAEALNKTADGVGQSGSSLTSAMASIAASFSKPGGGFGSLFGGGGGGAADPLEGASWFANGGIMTGRGSLPLRSYATGGVANSPQLALFGEGRGPEAYVPLPDGRSIPVSMDVPLMSPAPAAGPSGGGGGGVTIIDQRTNAAQPEVKSSPGGNTEIILRDIESAQAGRATRGQGPFKSAIGGPGYRRG